MSEEKEDISLVVKEIRRLHSAVVGLAIVMILCTVAILLTLYDPGVGLGVIALAVVLLLASPFVALIGIWAGKGVGRILNR